MRVEYSSNNSGGSWWLNDEHWKALEAAGWFVLWGGLWFCHSKYEHGQKPRYIKTLCDGDSCKGHRKFESADEIKSSKDRYSGALASSAWKEFPSLKDAIVEWENVVGMEASDEGCNCCGAPHSFSACEGKEWQYASGEDIVGILYRKAPRSLRDAARRLSGELE